MGGVATLVALLIFNGLVHGYAGGPGPLRSEPLVAYYLANTLSMGVSFSGSRMWAFRHRETVGPTGGRIAYVLINTASMVIPIGCLAFSRYVLHRTDAMSDNLAANGVGLLLGTVCRFLLFRRFVFLSPHRAERLRERPRLVPSRPGSGPQLVPGHVELGEQHPEQRQAHPDHVVRVPLDRGDVGAA